MNTAVYELWATRADGSGFLAADRGTEEDLAALGNSRIESGDWASWHIIVRHVSVTFTSGRTSWDVQA